MKTKTTITQRGFGKILFDDLYGAMCSLQQSSLGSEAAIWLGLEDASPQLMAADAKKLGLPTFGADNGWVPYLIPKEVLLSTRMHLNVDGAKTLIGLLQEFVAVNS